MAKGFKHGAGGGTSLNFKVVGGTSAPSNPKENTIWVNTSNPITSWQFGTEYRGKNLLKNTAKSKTVNGVTFTVNDDGSVTVNGTATGGYARLWYIDSGEETKIDYLGAILSGGSKNVNIYVQGSAEINYSTLAINSGGDSVISDGNTGYNPFLAGHYRLFINVSQGVTVNNETVYPMIRLASEKDDTYVPYGGAENGAVWFFTGTSSSSEFNALKKNSIMVYPMSTKQYVNGAWVSKDARIQKDGNLKAFHFVVVPNIDINWVSSNTTVNKTSTATELSITVKSSADSSKGAAGSYVEVDTTGYDTIFVKIKHKANNTTGSDQGFSVALETASGTAVASGFGLSIPKYTNSAEQTLERTIDISALSGVYRLWFRATTYSSSSTIHYVTITDCRLC